MSSSMVSLNTERGVASLRLGRVRDTGDDGAVFGRALRECRLISSCS